MPLSVCFTESYRPLTMTNLYKSKPFLSKLRFAKFKFHPIADIQSKTYVSQQAVLTHELEEHRISFTKMIKRPLSVNCGFGIHVPTACIDKKIFHRESQL